MGIILKKECTCIFCYFRYFFLWFREIKNISIRTNGPEAKKSWNKFMLLIYAMTLEGTSYQSVYEETQQWCVPYNSNLFIWMSRRQVKKEDCMGSDVMEVWILQIHTGSKRITGNVPLCWPMKYSRWVKWDFRLLLSRCRVSFRCFRVTFRTDALA